MTLIVIPDFLERHGRQNRGIAFDEAMGGARGRVICDDPWLQVTYNFAMYGVLLNKKQDDELARQAPWAHTGSYGHHGLGSVMHPCQIRWVWIA